MLPIVGVSLEEALLGFGGDDTELHDKEVTLTTSDVTGSQTAVFEYDPQNEPVTGTPPGPWDGYSLFTIDLSGVKEDIEGYLAQISALEDELEEYQECCEEVVLKIQIYFPDFDPDEDPIPDAIDDVYDKGIDDAPEKYTFPEDDPTDPDPDRYDNILKAIGNDNLTDNDLHIIVKPMDVRYPEVPQGQHNVFYGFYDSVTGAFIDRTQAFQGTIDPDHPDYVSNFHITDPTTGAYSFDWVVWSYLYNPPIWGWVHYTYTGTNQHLIGYGDPTHSYTVSKNS